MASNRVHRGDYLWFLDCSIEKVVPGLVVDISNVFIFLEYGKDVIKVPKPCVGKTYFTSRLKAESAAKQVLFELEQERKAERERIRQEQERLRREKLLSMSIDELVAKASKELSVVHEALEKTNRPACRCNAEEVLIAKQATEMFLIAFEKNSLNADVLERNKFYRKHLPTLASCYRCIKEPEKVFALLEQYGGEKSYLFESAFFCSLSAAFVDLQSPEHAWYYWNLALKKNRRFESEALKKVRVSIEWLEVILST